MDISYNDSKLLGLANLCAILKKEEENSIIEDLFLIKFDYSDKFFPCKIGDFVGENKKTNKKFLRYTVSYCRSKENKNKKEIFWFVNPTSLFIYSETRYLEDFNRTCNTSLSPLKKKIQINNTAQDPKTLLDRTDCIKYFDLVCKDVYIPKQSYCMIEIPFKRSMELYTARILDHASFVYIGVLTAMSVFSIKSSDMVRDHVKKWMAENKQKFGNFCGVDFTNSIKNVEVDEKRIDQIKYIRDYWIGSMKQSQMFLAKIKKQDLFDFQRLINIFQPELGENLLEFLSRDAKRKECKSEEISMKKKAKIIDLTNI